MISEKADTQPAEPVNSPIYAESKPEYSPSYAESQPAEPVYSPTYPPLTTPPSGMEIKLNEYNLSIPFMYLHFCTEITNVHIRMVVNLDYVIFDN